MEYNHFVIYADDVESTRIVEDALSTIDNASFYPSEESYPDKSTVNVKMTRDEFTLFWLATSESRCIKYAPIRIYNVTHSSMVANSPELWWLNETI